jgi:hypothetical protein
MDKQKESPSRPSEQICRFINQVNLAGRSPLEWPHEFVPGAWIFDDLELWVDEDLDELRSPDESEKKWLHEMRYFLYHALYKMSAPFREFIWGDVSPERYNDAEEEDPSYHFPTVWKGTVRAAIRYQQTRALIKQMDYLVDLTGRIAESTTNSQKLNWTQRQYISAKLGDLPESTIFTTTEKGVLTVAASGILAAMDGKELGRLRRCKKCENIFWAKRSDSKCCSLTCNNNFNALRSTNKRKNDPEAHKWKRYISEAATKRAQNELQKIGYEAEHIRAYRHQYRKFPHRVIYDYLVENAIDNKRGPDKVPLPEKITDPLKKFLFKIG